MARSVSDMALISPKRTPRERVVAAPITRNPVCPARELTPSVSLTLSEPSKRKIRHTILELPTSKIAMTPRCIAAFRILRIAR